MDNSTDIKHGPRLRLASGEGKPRLWPIAVITFGGCAIVGTFLAYVMIASGF